MTDDTTIIPFRQPGSIIDPLTEIARDGARRMLMAALKAEADSFVAQFSEDRLVDGRQRIVRHGAGPERVIQTGLGPIEVRRQKVRDRARECPVFCVWLIGSMLPERSQDDDDFERTAGRAAEGLQAA